MWKHRFIELLDLQAKLKQSDGSIQVCLAEL